MFGFAGGGLASFGNAALFACGSTECTGSTRPLAFTAGVTFWLNPYIAFEGAYLKPGEVRLDGGVDTLFTYTSGLDTNVLTIVGKGDLPLSYVRIYGFGGLTWGRAHWDTLETIDDQTISVDGVETTVTGGAQGLDLYTQGWNWVAGAGMEIPFSKRDGASGLAPEFVPDFHWYQPSVQITGPIVRDRLWYHLTHSTRTPTARCGSAGASSSRTTSSGSTTTSSPGRSRRETSSRCTSTPIRRRIRTWVFRASFPSNPPGRCEREGVRRRSRGRRRCRRFCWWTARSPTRTTGRRSSRRAWEFRTAAWSVSTRSSSRNAPRTEWSAARIRSAGSTGGSV